MCILWMVLERIHGCIQLNNSLKINFCWKNTCQITKSHKNLCKKCLINDWMARTTKRERMRTHVFGSHVLWDIMIITLYKLYIISHNPKPNPHKKLCIFIFSKRHNLVWFISSFPHEGQKYPLKVTDFCYYYPCGDIHCVLKHTQITLLIQL